MRAPFLSTSFALVLTCGAATHSSAGPEAIFHGGKIVTVDGAFSVHEAMAVADGRIVAVGGDEEVLRMAEPGVTRLHALHGRMLLPGLIDSHVHPTAALTEFDHEIPEMETIQDVLDYFAARARVVPEGEWIRLEQVFITRLREQRYPTRAELDGVAPHHPVVFRTGPDAMLNSMAMAKRGIDRDFEIADGDAGRVEKDATGEPTGLLRGLARYVGVESHVRQPSAADVSRRTQELFRSYNQTGITTIAERRGNASSVSLYERLRAQNDLTVRIAISHTFPTIGSMASVFAAIDQIGEHPLRQEDPWLRIIGTKIFLDGGMLTGSAYMLQPWGRSEMYGIEDAEYRGVLNVPPERLFQMVERVAQHGLQFTAHAVGDGAVTVILDAYQRLNRERPVRDLRLGVTHSNFMTAEAVETAAHLGVVMDLQPAWLYLDTRTLVKQFGYERLRWFQPLRSLFRAGVVAAGGSDHMLKIGDLRAINPYNPFLGMWVTMTRKAKWHEGPLHAEEGLTREQAIQFYTRNGAWMLFWEDEVGSLEVGKRADFIILDRDLLECPVDDIKDTQVVQTWLEGRLVYQANVSP